MDAVARQIWVVGIGAGNPEHITIEAINVLNGADVLFVPTKGADKADLAEVRRQMIARYVTNRSVRVVEYRLPERDGQNPSYRAGVDDWHDAIGRLYQQLFAAELPAGGVGAFLVWGDPGLYDSTLRILERVIRAGMALDIKVVPGISAVQALTAAHAVPLNRIGEPVLVTTGRRLEEAPEDLDRVVMLDGKLAFSALDGARYDIFWGAYLGTEREILVSGRLGDVAQEIADRRAAARAEHGWIMDCYLLRRRGAETP